MIEFTKYARVKDHYCLCYYGPSEEYLVQLKLLKPVIEAHFPGIKLGFGCRDEAAYIFGPNYNVMKVSEIKVKRESFAHSKEIKFNGVIHPIEEFLNECEIKNYAIPRLYPEFKTTKCVIVTKGFYPTKDLDIRQIEVLKRIAREEGYQSELDADVKGASLVMGVESAKLFEAAYLGADVKLIPTGIGTRFYRNAFPDINVMHT